MGYVRNAGPQCQIGKPEWIDEGTTCRAKSHLQIPAGTQRSMLSPEEQLCYPDGIEDDEITVAVVLFVAEAASIAVSAARVGTRAIVSIVRELLSTQGEEEMDTFAEMVAEKGAADTPPTAEQLQKIKDWAREANTNRALMNDEAEAANQNFIRTGNADFKEGSQGFRRWTPDEELMKRRLEEVLTNSAKK